MDYLEYRWLDPVPVVPVLLSAGNMTTIEATQLTPRAKLVLEILMVLMCLGAVTGETCLVV